MLLSRGNAWYYPKVFCVVIQVYCVLFPGVLCVVSRGNVWVMCVASNVNECYFQGCCVLFSGALCVVSRGILLLSRSFLCCYPGVLCVDSRGNVVLVVPPMVLLRF